MTGQYDVVSFSILLGILSLVPILVVTTTSFLKISLVLLVLRNAIGVQQVPPTLAIYGISLAMSVFVMAPTIQDIGKVIAKIEATSGGANGKPLLSQAKEASTASDGILSVGMTRTARSISGST